MAPSLIAASDLAVSSEIKTPDLRVHVTRIPFDDFFHLTFVRDGREVSEELEAEDTRKWFKERFTKPPSRETELAREEAIEKALDETWNFYEAWITIPGDVYMEPVKPFPQFQPQV
jgi:hypothetical protein